MNKTNTIGSLLQTALCLFVLQLSPAGIQAQPADTTRVFSQQSPLVYEDARDLWPYVFLNEDGEPVGYNIDLLKLIMHELHIPYVVKLKETREALDDVRNGKADLTCGMDAHFHNDYARYGQTVIQIFTHSVLHQKGEPTPVKDVGDLARHRVIVHDGSFSHHLMKQRGWGANAVPYDDMKEAVLRVHNDAGNQIVWNTMSLKWLVHALNYSNLELTPINVPHGEYKFMANNTRLLQRLDSVYAVLQSSGQLQAIQNKWFYPERKDSVIPSWIWKVAGIMLLIIAIAVGSFLVYRRIERQMTRAIRRSNAQLANILRTSRLRLWTIHVASKTMKIYDENGIESEDDVPIRQLLETMQPADDKRLMEALTAIANKREEQISMDALAKDADGRFTRNVTITLSVMRRSRTGRVTHIIGTTNDVTELHLQQMQAKDSMLRYLSIFQSSMVDTVVYDAEGYMTDMNDKASRAFSGGRQAAIDNRYNLRDVLGDDFPPLEQLRPMHLTRVYEAGRDVRVFNSHLHRRKMYYELQLIPIRDAQGKLKTIFGTGRDITEMVRSYNRLQENARQIEQTNESMRQYIDNTNFVLSYGGVRMAYYSPTTHTLTIYSGIDKVQNQLTQTHGLNLTDVSSKRAAQRMLNSMDNLANATMTATIKTILRTKQHQRLSLYFSFVPTTDDSGRVTGYFGMCRDISEIKNAEEQLALETQKAQEVETVKNAFLRNMSYEIRTPLNSVVGFAELFSQEHSDEDEPIFINEIKENAAHLLRLINDILFLSRLDARMIEFKQQTTDFATIFEPRCLTAWYNCRKEGVDFVVDNPYQRLMLDIDEQNLGLIIDQVIANAAEHTQTGQVRVFYDYTGDELAIAFQDTGSGMSPERLAQVFERFGSANGQGTGLGLPICNELARQMGGRIRIKSELGSGTIVWVTIPCKCSELERK